MKFMTRVQFIPKCMCFYYFCGRRKKITYVILPTQKKHLNNLYISIDLTKLEKKNIDLNII